MKYMTLINYFKSLFDKYSWVRKKTSSREYFSQSKKYKLVVNYFSQGKGYWDYTKGTIYRTSDNKKLFEVNRNYSSFWYCFVENHQNGHDYMLCGSNYQGQTVLELDTGIRKDYVPKSAEQGAGFCWTGVTPNESKTIIAVDGCFWACPYEFVFYDFSEPLNLPYRELGRMDALSDGKWVDDCIYEMKSDNNKDEDVDDEDRIEYDTYIWKKLANGNCIVEKTLTKTNESYIESVIDSENVYYAYIENDDNDVVEKYTIISTPLNNVNWSKARENSIEFSLNAQQEWKDYMKNKARNQ